MIGDEAYRELAEIVGEENVARDPAVLDTYAWQPTINDDPAKWVQRPEAVVLPGSTEEVQEIVRALGRHGLKFKAFSTGWGVFSGPTSPGVVQVDMRRMNRIIEIDSKNMYAVLEPYVCGAQLQAEAMKVGLNTHIIGAGPVCSPLASATSGWGVGWDGISMSYSCRNVLGVEWVLPDGEMLRLGTPGSDLGWFSGDGPGPSLRGIMRGSTGALSGLGIFTKVAVKLFNWSGPAQVHSDGMLLDVQTELPENTRFHVCLFPDRKSLADAVYKIGEAEIGYLSLRTAAASFVYSFAPHLLRKLKDSIAFRGIFNGTMKWTYVIMLHGASPGDIDYQETALREILLEHGGLSMEMTQAGPIGKMVFMNFFRATGIALVFRMGGLFTTALDRNDTWDTQLDWGELGVGIKERLIREGRILDDMADNVFMPVYENNAWGHCEDIIQYDARNPEHLAALEPIFIEFSIAAIEQCMEPLSATDARLRKVISPLMGHFNDYQRKISGMLDPGETADSGMYVGEVDFDYSKIDPALHEKLERLLAEYTWTRQGPPGTE
jgi:glycolate oxidase